MRKFIVYPLIVLAGVFVGLWLGNGSVWTLVYGPPDLGRADYAQAARPSNQFVACAGSDAGCTAPDLTLTIHPASPESVLAVVGEAARGAERVDDGSDPLHRRYVARSAAFRFPDTIDVTALPTNGGTALRVSSRSQIGESDFGVNERRVRDWLARAGIRPASPAG